MSLKVFVSRSIWKKIDKIEPMKTRERIKNKIYELEQNPRLTGSIRLSEKGKKFRIRVGNYRILYMISDSTIDVYRVDHRRSAYRKRR